MTGTSRISSWVPACPRSRAARSRTSPPVAVPPTDLQAQGIMMDAKTYTAQLAELRALRDDIKKTQATLAKLETNRARQITALAGYEKANAERIAPAAGLSLADVVAIAPILAPDQLANPAPTAQTAAAVSPPVPAREA